MDRATDERLAELAAQGDERAFALLYTRYGRRLHGYCRSIVGNDEDAHDALQSCMLKALRALRANGGDLHVRPWMFRIAHNESISLIRARRGHEALQEDIWVTDAGPADHAEMRDELDDLVDGMRGLSERRRRALVMRELSGFGYPAIAAALGTSAGAAKQAVFEARSALSARRRAAGLLGPLAPVWSALTGWLGAGLPTAAKAGALVVALAAGTGTAEQLISDDGAVRAPVAEAASTPTPAVTVAERAPGRTAAHSQTPRPGASAPPVRGSAAARTALVRPAGRQAPAARPSGVAGHPDSAAEPRSDGRRPQADREERPQRAEPGHDATHQDGAPQGAEGTQVAARPLAPQPEQGPSGGGDQRSGRSGYTSSMVARGR